MPAPETTSAIQPQNVSGLAPRPNHQSPPRGSLLFSSVRQLERLLPLSLLCPLVQTFALARATLNTAFKNPHPGVPLPDFLQAAWTRPLVRQRRINTYLNRPLEYFPDRLADLKWHDRCTVTGRDLLLKLREQRRPAVLAFCHIGPIFFMHPWLRAFGIPCAALVGGNSADRRHLNRITDHLVRFPEIPTRFHLDQLKAATEFLATGNLLFVALDVAAGKQMDVPFCEGWTFRMATGAIRLAARHQAQLIPCTVISDGPWRFRIEVGQPVPSEFLATEANWPRAGEHLLSEIFPHIQAYPEQCRIELIRCLRKN